MGNQYVKIIQKNKGAFKNYLKKIEQIQDFKATCGIHKDVGRLKVKSGSIKKIKAKRDSKKSVLRKDAFGQEFFGAPDQKPSNKNYHKVAEGIRRYRAKRKSRLNLATLSSILERHITWTQRNSATIPCADGSTTVTVNKDSKMRQPARIFIHLENKSEVWAEVQKRIQTQSMLYMLKLQSSRGKRSAQELFLDIANWVSERQRQRITRRETTGNSELTMKIKGFNYPLFDKGTLLSSIKGRVERNSTGRKVRCAYVAENMEKQIAKINAFVGR